MKRVFLCATLALGALVSACGGSSGSELAPLESKADVVRELVALDGFIDFVNGATPVTTSTPDDDEDDSPLGPLFDLLPLLGANDSVGARRASDLSTESVPAKAATTSNCKDGGTQTTDSGTKLRDFPFFAVQQHSVNYTVALSTNCTRIDNASSDPGSNTYTYVSNGSVEQGESAASTGGVTLSYSVLGSAAAPVATSVTERKGSSVVSEFRFFGHGIEETRESATVKENAHLYDIELTTEDGRGSVAAGEGSTPFKTSKSLPSGALSLNGSYRRETDCATARVAVSTPTALTALRDSRAYVAGGVIKLASGEATATVTFSANGSATFQITGGASGSITRAEFEAALDSEGCL